MKINNLSNDKKIELADLFLSNVFSIYEFSKFTGIREDDILKIFYIDLYGINKRKAHQVNKVLRAYEEKKCIYHKGYVRELVANA